MRLILASNNPHKEIEFVRLLGASGVEIAGAETVGGMPPVDETGTTFRENARLKAEALRPRLGAEDFALADDSGLEVDALGGAPGVRSARFAGPHASDADNVAKLLQALEGVPVPRREARFVCVLCVVGRGGEARYFAGTCEGRILGTAAGAEGFGYDPVFQPAGYEGSFASLGKTVKDRLSHRARAAKALRAAALSGFAADGGTS
ncbi:MAG: non-canonical purine NTP pyrophosphatase [Opitutales bacterium]|nr:non-canonical purine NTP pyrophosphatase [Opitutales bacterium]